jgi:hypothetical protein
VSTYQIWTISDGPDSFDRTVGRIKLVCGCQSELMIRVYPLDRIPEVIRSVQQGHDCPMGSKDGVEERAQPTEQSGAAGNEVTSTDPN